MTKNKWLFVVSTLRLYVMKFYILGFRGELFATRNASVSLSASGVNLGSLEFSKLGFPFISNILKATLHSEFPYYFHYFFFPLEVE